MDCDDLEKAGADEEVQFLPEVQLVNQKSTNNMNSADALLSRDDLLNLSKKEPKWRRLRIGIMAIFGIVWLSLLIASIIIIVLSPSCPHVPSLTFWQSKVGYWVDPFAFHDTTGDLIGDFEGLIKKIEYIKDTVGAGFIILDGFLMGHYSAKETKLGLVTDFKNVDSTLGTMNDFRALLKAYHKNGLQVVVKLDFNSVPASHEWASKYFVTKLEPSVVSRIGEAADVNGHYSSFGGNTVDLNLKDSELTDKIKDIIAYWLYEGIDGILLDNAAFYFEQDMAEKVNGYDVKTPENDWFKTYPSKQLFVNGSLDFIRKIRETVDRVSSETGKPRLLAVNSGDIGFGLSNNEDKTTSFIGSDSTGAHLVVSRQFVFNRGWKSTPIEAAMTSPSINSYSVIYKNYMDKLALATATPTDRYYDNIVSLASIFLLPGTPLLYYGAELGQNYSETVSETFAMYPKNKRPLVDLSKSDSQWSCHLPMPWDRNGIGFSSKTSVESFNSFLTKLNINETVESATAPGRGYSAMQLVQALIKLRKTPSLLWGKFEKIETKSFDSSASIEMFSRKAADFPTYVVLLIQEGKAFKGVVPFSDSCKGLRLRFAYPSLPDLELDKPVKGNRVFIDNKGKATVSVFECQDV